MSTPTFGWLADPTGRHELRYKDPERGWTAHVSDAGAQADDPYTTDDVAKAMSRNASPTPAPVRSRAEALQYVIDRDIEVKLGIGAELKRLPEVLRRSETLKTVAKGVYKNNTGIIAVTNERVLFYDKRLVGDQIEDFPLANITSIATSTRMMSATITIYIGSHASEIKNVMPKDNAAKVVDHVRTLQADATSSSSSAPAPVAAPAPAVAPAPTMLDQLEQLVRLRDAGALTDDEFAQQKARLLG